MIRIWMSQDNSRGLVWNVEDIKTLREDYRIVGNLIGGLAKAPRQVSLNGVPLALIPEEINVLVEIKVAKLVRVSDPAKPVDSETKDKYELAKAMNFQEQVEAFKAERIAEVHRMKDVIVEGKRKQIESKKRDVIPEDEPDVDDPEFADKIIEQELAKIKPIQEHHALIQTRTEHPWYKEEDFENIDWELECNVERNSCKMKTFHKLWTEGFYLTLGDKFGCDFLAYPGDPLRYHAKFVVICKENIRSTEDIEAIGQRDLVAMSRLGTTVKKTVMISFLDQDDQVKFKTLKWTDRL